ncbi:TIGR04086 family membrane protein [Paenibacillus sp. SYP-B4298]|uniref:TIGR04086 family membrane protein n=1 Tax=Paenibacillus sp. SYP-B4298 TaxID=2996034 RepID=UPI0022DD541B|nr:TIGR04086 family membrane protein [Paenibacillus sp. SYP-B4298]
MNLIKKTTRIHIASPLLSGILYAFIGLGASIFLLSLLLQFSSMQETSLPNLSYAAHGVCSLVGGITAGRRASRRGWYHGGLCGMVYGLVIMMIGFLSLDLSLSSHSLALLSLVLAAGAVGGMAGVNTKKG